MSDLQTSLVQSAFYGAYFCVALPASIFISRHTYKSGIILGLALYASGTMLFYPAGQCASYGFFLFAIYIMAAGCAVLETTANPCVLSMGPAATATRRLNIAQSLNPVGAVAGILISRHFILSELHDADAATRAAMDSAELEAMQSHELSAISGVYILIGAVLLVLLAGILFVRMPDGSDSHSSNLKSTFRALFRNRRWRYGVVAQFFYVGVQTGVWSFTIRLAMDRLGVKEADASTVFLWSIIAFTLFRFLFTWLMGYIKPVRLLAVAAIAAIMCTAGVIFTNGETSIVFLVAVSACMSLMFPTIYGIALEGVAPERMKLAAAGLIMAILGGAVITPVQAWVSDRFGIGISFIVPVICFAVVLSYTLGVILHHPKPLTK